MCHFARKTQQRDVQVYVDTFCLLRDHRFNRFAHSQGLRKRMYACTMRIQKFHFRLHWRYCTASGAQNSRAETIRATKVAISRINNTVVEQRFYRRRFSRARVGTKGPDSLVTIRENWVWPVWCLQPEYQLASQNTKWPASPWPLSLPTTPTSDCNGSRYNRVLTHYAESQKPLSLITLTSSSLSHSFSVLPSALFFSLSRRVRSCACLQDTRQRARRESKRERKRKRRVGLAEGLEYKGGGEV